MAVVGSSDEGKTYTTQEPFMVARYSKGAKLIDNRPSTDATANVYIGPWTDVSVIRQATAQVIGTGFTGTVNIEGTNLENPQPADVGFPLCTAPTASSMNVLTPLPVRFARARISGFTAGSVRVLLHGVS